MTAQDYFDKEVIKTRRAAKAAIKEIIDLPRNKVKEAGHAMNNAVFKSRFPITYMHVKKAIDGGGRIKHNAKSKAAIAILASPELKKIARKQENCSFQQQIFFTRNLDLAGAIYDAPIYGEITREGRKLKVNAMIEDDWDFRLSLIPKDFSIQGNALRYAGNIGYLLQELGLLKTVKVTVEINGYIK